MDKKRQWEIVKETLQAALTLVEAMDEKPSVQYALYKLIQTAEAQAKLWPKYEAVTVPDFWIDSNR
jgi:hypothetical protein